MAGPMSSQKFRVACLLISVRQPITRLFVAGCRPAFWLTYRPGPLCLT